jgi:predicted AlkP superfamily phosphohydrolase/phosphomutase
MSATRERRPKVLIIGLDGGTWTLLDRMCDAGWMPRLRQLRDGGVAEPLLSTIPYTSPVAWTSFLTGLRPGNHRVYGFVAGRNTYVEGQEGYAAGRPINASAIGADPLWLVMNRHDVRVGLLNVPVTYPPQPIDGYIVGDELFTPDESSDYAYPPDLKARLLDAVPEFRVRPFRYAHELAEFIREVTHYTREQGKAAQWLLQEYPVDLPIFVFTATDRIQHRFWKYLDPTHPAHDEAAAHPHTIHLLELFYRTIDEIVGSLVDQAQPDVVFMVSDHGFTASHRLFLVNRWLHAEGLLSFEASTVGRAQQLLLNLGLTQEKLFGFLKRLDVLRLRDRIRAGGRHALKLQARRGVQNVLAPRIDWTQTQAYGGFIGEPFIYVNQAGREPAGIVEPGAPYDRLRGEIRERLLSLRDPDTGQLVLDEVFLREELYSGPYLEEAPDLIFTYRDPAYYTTDAVQTTDFLQPERAQRGIHERPGIFLAAGSNIVPEAPARPFNIYDVLPTAMYLLGVPLPPELDGRVLEEIIDPDYVAAHPIDRETVSPASETLSEPTDYSDVEAEQIESRLQDLGYL